MPHRPMLRSLVVIATTTLAGVAAADVFTDIKYFDLAARLGASTPTGAGVGVGQIEAPENAAGSYAPDTALPEFSGKTFTLLSGTGLAPSGHATEVSRNLFGTGVSIARGVTSIYNWNANPWITSAYLRVGSGGTAPPLTPPTGVRVLNHSWIGSFGTAANDNDALRRIDYAVTRDNILVAIGTNNGAGSAGQALLSYAFNGMTVGLADGNHSNSPTPVGIDGPNRRKPDIVAPNAFTSFSTPVVGAAAALLFETATTNPSISGNPNANRALTLKSVMMAGTTHRAAWTNGAPASGASRGITTTPLDQLYGADLLNIDRAHAILTAGEVNGSTVVLPATFSRHQGWDYIPTVASGASVYWSFRIAQPVSEVSVLASWHRQVALNFTAWTLQDLDLKLSKLVDGTPVAISGDAGAAVFASGNCESASTTENTEHLFLRNLAAGDYVLQLTRKVGTQVAMPIVVSWYMPDTPVPGDVDGDMVVGGADITALLGQWGGPGTADFDGSGVVDGLDLTVLLSNWG